VLAALCGFAAALPLAQIPVEVFKSVGRPAFLARQTAISAVLSLAAVAAFLPLGAVGVGAGVSIAWAVVGFYSVWSLASLLEAPLRGILRELVPPALAALGMMAVLLAVDRLSGEGGSELERLAVLLLDAVIGAAVYLALLAVLKPALFRELVDLRRFRRRVPAGAPSKAAH
jgi:O-antigen/teichoic acid export membrane protein